MDGAGASRFGIGYIYDERFGLHGAHSCSAKRYWVFMLGRQHQNANAKDEPRRGMLAF